MFLYRFIKGECPASFGINVARMAGMPDAVLKKAKARSEQFNKKVLVLQMQIRKQKI